MSFPLNPIDQQTYTSNSGTVYKWASADNAWNIVSQTILGQTGVQGTTGLVGSTGIQGVTGIYGGTGIQGVTGFYGQTGVQGVTGLIGGTGVQGVTGFIGGTGIQGVTGIFGQTGIQGVTGLVGGTGIQGGTGILGQTGIQGGTGIQGQTGIQGVTGFVGGTGIQGQTGFGVTGIGDNIRAFSWIISSPAIGGIPGSRLKETATATEISAATTAASGILFNIEHRTAMGATGLQLMASSMLAGITGMSTATLQNTSMTANKFLWLDIRGVTGTPGIATITVAATV